MNTIEKIHPVTITETAPSELLGKEIMALRYDLLLPVIAGMLKEAKRQEDGDRGRGRVKLAHELHTLVIALEQAHLSVEAMIAICQPYIDTEKKVYL